MLSKKSRRDGGFTVETVGLCQEYVRNAGVRSQQKLTYLGVHVRLGFCNPWVIVNALDHVARH